ncbi:MAG: hypothetical protein HKN73_09720 [Gemmatimonadetes bacterium]|nr:hypothetical protein [Gemmatimonadota bacterium]
MKTLIDGHVHLYDNHEAKNLVDAAAGAFSREGERLGIESAARVGCMVVVDPSGVDGFERLERLGAPGWEHTPGGSCALEVVRESDGLALWVVAGRQIRTDNGLEVLAYGVRRPFEDGGRLPDQVEKVLESGAVPVIPWGFGKWLGRRGRDVEVLLRSSLGRHVVLADSLTRPAVAPEPRAFRVARAQAIPVIAGTDPLPFRGQERKAGKYGFVLELGEDPEGPAAGLGKALGALRESPTLFGRREGLISALRLQVAMQLRGVGGRAGHAEPGR